jgi:N-dimethylarginine dimethylaminohydrolase
MSSTARAAVRPQLEPAEADMARHEAWFETHRSTKRCDAPHHEAETPRNAERCDASHHERGARLLMCRPEHFAVSYIINPWMDPQSWARDRRAHVAAVREWSALYRKLVGLGASIEQVTPAPGLPDLVFTANAAVVLDRQVLLARFRHPERRREEPHFEAAFRALQARGLVDCIRKLPDDVVLEGAGDCVWDESRKLFWLGYGPRSDAAAQRPVADMFAQEVAALELVDPRFYHMDTALAPLPGGEVMYLPQAFSAAALGEIRERVSPDARIELGLDDGCRLAANAVCLGRTLVLSGCSEALRGELAERGYRVAATPLPSFLRSGGSAFCLTLRLDRRSAALPNAGTDAAVA